jgi:CRISPR associated protein, Cas1 family
LHSAIARGRLSGSASPSFGFLHHADAPDRLSLSYDVIELLRPRVDTCVFGFLKSRPFDRKEFVESGSQVLLAPKTAREIALRVLAEVPLSQCEEAAGGRRRSRWAPTKADAENFVNELRSMNATPHVAQNANGRSSTINGRTTRHAGYAISQRIRKTDRGSLRLDEDDRRAGEDQVPRPRSRPLDLRLHWMRPPISRGCPSSWRKPHERAGQRQARRPLADRRGQHLGPRLPRSLSARDHDDRRRRSRAEIAFGAGQAGLDIEYSRSSVGFAWEGFDEMEDGTGAGSAKLIGDGSIEIEFAYHNADEAVPKAKRETSSTAV